MSDGRDQVRSTSEWKKRAREAEARGEKKEASVAWVHVASRLIRAKRFVSALAVLKQAEKLSPELARLQLHLAHCEIRLKRERDAQRSVARFGKMAVQAKKVAEYLQYVEQDLRRYPSLRRIFLETVLTLDRTGAVVFLALARLHRDSHDQLSSLRTLIDALMTRDRTPEVLAELRVSLNELGRAQDVVYLERFEAGKISREDLAALLAPTPAPESQSDPAVFDEPAREKTLGQLISDLEKELDGGESNGAEEGMDKVRPLLAEFRSRAEKVIGEDSRARLDMALAYFEMGLYAVAQEEIARIPSSARCYLEGQSLLGEIFLKQGSDLAALEVYQKMLRTQLGPGASQDVANEAHYRLAEIYLRLGDRSQAVMHVREVEKKDPSYRRLKHLQEALGVGGSADIGTKRRGVL